LVLESLALSYPCSIRVSSVAEKSSSLSFAQAPGFPLELPVVADAPPAEQGCGGSLVDSIPALGQEATMEIRRVAVIYDDRDRPETTGVYCRRALEGLVDVAHFRPDQLADIPRKGFDLFLNIDDGLEYHLPDELHRSAWWAIDTHLNFD